MERNFVPNLSNGSKLEEFGNEMNWNKKLQIQENIIVSSIKKF